MSKVHTPEELGHTAERIEHDRAAARPSIRPVETDHLNLNTDLHEGEAVPRPKPLGGRTAGEVFVQEAQIIRVEDDE